MKRKVLGMVLATSMVAATLVGGGDAAPAATEPAAETEAPAAEAEAEAPAADAEAEAPAADAAAPSGNKVGVAMPTKDLQRWNQDGSNMQAELEAAGYEVDLQYASNDVATQVSQIENMINGGCSVLVIASIDGESLTTVLEGAKSKNIPVIAYDRLIKNTDAISYYATFDNYKVGQTQGQYIVDALDLDNAEGPFNMEITGGSPDDNNATFFYNGAIDVLKPYMDAGKIVVPSGQIDFATVGTPAWATETAQARMENILSSNYSDGTTLHIALSTALGVENALAANYTGDYPVVTGQDCDIANVKNMIDGKQSMSVFKDTRTLASQVVKMVGQILKGETVEVNDTETYDNGTGVIPSYLCEPVFADANNYKELLIDSGYYTEADLQ